MEGPATQFVYGDVLHTREYLGTFVDGFTLIAL